MKLNLPWRNSKRSGTTNDACRRPLTRWEQWGRLTMGKIDNTSCHQHRSEAEGPTEETRSLLQTIPEQVVSDVDAEMASTGLELEAEHWQWMEAAAAHRYTRALEL
jgi:hypothetical protein